MQVLPQVLSRRINYGRYVAEVKFRGDQQTYTTLIQAKVQSLQSIKRLIEDMKI
jgi:chorismate mutase